MWFNRLSICQGHALKLANEMWDKLQIIYEGPERVKQVKLQTYKG